MVPTESVTDSVPVSLPLERLNLLSRVGRFIVSAAVLGLIWFFWRPVYFTLPEDLIQPDSAEGLALLVPGQAFLLEGRVEPVTSLAAPSWQERFVFVHRRQQEMGDGAGRNTQIVVVDEQRGPVLFTWAGGQLTLPANSYELRHAPRVPHRSWPRKWLWTTPVDDWHKSSSGFKPGEAALALARKDPTGVVRVESLLRTPREAVAREIGQKNRLRAWLVTGAKVVATLLMVSYCVPAWTGVKPRVAVPRAPP